MSALSVASDVKEEEGGGCYESCSMLKQSDGDTARSRRASLFRSLLQTLTLIRCFTQGHRGIEPERALRTCRSAGKDTAPRARCVLTFLKSPTGGFIPSYGKPDATHTPAAPCAKTVRSTCLDKYLQCNRVCSCQEPVSASSVLLAH